MRLVLAAAFALMALAPALALEPREGWFVQRSAKPYAALLADLKAAVVAEKMAVVTEAGPTETAAARGVTIPGNRVVGVFRNDLAVRALAASEAAMIEAPLRFYVVERADGATLAFKRPAFAFAPYAEEGGPALAAVVAELEAAFAAIAERALR